MDFNFLQKISSGAEADVFSLDSIRVVKRYTHGRKVSKFEKGLVNAENVFFPIVFDIDDDYVVMERLHGSLGGYQFFDRATVHTIGGVKKVVEWLLKLKTYLDITGIQHHDINPSNIMFDKNHDLKLIDFGWANATQKELEEAKVNPHYSQDDTEAIKKLIKELEMYGEE